MKPYGAGSLFAICTLLAACDPRPKESLASEAVRGHIDSGKEDRVKLVDFRKIDGQEAELLGVKIYAMEFTAAAEFTDEAWVTTGGSIMEPNVRITTTPIEQTPSTCGQSLNACFSQTPRRASKGDRIDLAGTVTFEKKESGWSVAAVDVSMPNGVLLSEYNPASPGPATHLSDERLAAAESTRSGWVTESWNRPDASVCQAALSSSIVLRIADGGEDAYVGDVYGKQGTSGEEALSFGGWGDHYYSYLRFSTPPKLRSGIKRAVLCVFATAVPKNDPGLVLSLVTEEWNAGALSIASRPEHRELGPAGSIQPGWNAFDVTTWVADWSSGRNPNYGWVFVPRFNDEANGAFASAEAKDESHRPRLVIEGG
jgi:hypothetical protein